MYHTLFHISTQAAAADAGQPTPDAALKAPPSAPFKVRHPLHQRRSVFRLGGAQHLRLRCGVWHFRRRVPLDLVTAFGGPEVTLSLRTDRLLSSDIRI